ncbi:hypothetical protein NSA50_14745 [Clostridium sp. DSM 100503]|uniref:hypothetical protein n=1 Tax=Clostridium sp. DSM 100503 TaxID=2963282 RepID=UPI00214A56A7|nr:hypothetical protein [Clostridium sp. DSM 100503]MCR1952287.1 hypothetical protein [Clostridium sp. DSM 100503]
MFNKKVLIGTIIFSLLVFIGFVQINIVNTRALSPIGNGEDNYQLVKEEFGEDFEEFIRDNAEVKIYTTDENNENTTIKVSDKEFMINANNPITEKIYMLGSNIYNGFNSIKNKINEKIKSDYKDEEINSINESNEENGDSKEGSNDTEGVNDKESESSDKDKNTNSKTTNDKLDKIVDDFLEKSN